MQNHKVVSHDEWVAARRLHLDKEKEFTRMRDQLSEARRELPWTKVEKLYVFDGPRGKESLAELFGNCSQLVVYHFMFGADWTEGCPSCSFWADNFNGIDIHLQHRDIQFLAISKGPLEKLEAYKRRLGWQFKWVSSMDNDFNRDYQVSFTPDELQAGEVYYNFGKRAFPQTEAPGISVFYKTEQGEIFRTYSCYARGLDMLNGAYHYIDLTPKGRDEAGLPFTMTWVRRRDQYVD
ncbi:MAG: thioredoxin family protein [Gammaproteobacteria bacterium]|nr:thioredoxin family protein [Gammaproteobacteria bacterium]